MEKLITVRELFKETDRFIDKTVQVGGWVRNNRGSKAFGFLVINDGSFYNTLQVRLWREPSEFLRDRPAQCRLGCHRDGQARRYAERKAAL